MKKLHLFIYIVLSSCPLFAQVTTLPLPDVLDSIRNSQTEYTIHYIHNDLEHLRISTRIKGLTVPKAVAKLCKGQPVKVKTRGKNIFVQYKPDKDFTGKKIHLSGEVKDGFLGMPLTHARVSVFKADSTLVADSLRLVIFYKGDMRPFRAAWTVEVSAAEHEYLVRAQSEGYDDVWQQVTIADPTKDEVDVPTLTMRKSTAKTMREVTVLATKIKMFWRGDTLIYDATAFKLPDGSMLDDLIRQLPGVTLNADGEIFVNGRKVDELLLGSRTFFGGNKKVLMENLPYYTVKNLKVYEKQTDRSIALGYDVDPRRYVMDVNLKDEYSQGYIGNVEAAGGTEKRWLGRGFLLGFTDKLRFTLLANANNVNEGRHIGHSDSWSPASQPRSLTTTRSVAGELNYQRKDEKVKETFRAEFTSTTDDQEMYQYRERFLDGLTPTAKTESFNRMGNRRWTLNNHLVLRLPTWIDIYANFNHTHRDGSSHSAFDEQTDSLSIAQRTMGISEGKKWSADIEAQGTIKLDSEKKHSLFYHAKVERSEDEGERASTYETRTDATHLQSSQSHSHNSNTLFTRNTWGVLSLSYNKQFANDLNISVGDMVYHTNIHTHEGLAPPLLPSQIDLLTAITDYANSYDSHINNWQSDVSFSINKHSYYTHPQVHMRVGYDRWRLGVKLPMHFDKMRYQRGMLDTLSRQRFIPLPLPSFSYRNSWKGAKRDFQANVSYSCEKAPLMDRISFRDDSQPLVVKLGNPDLKPTTVTNFNARYYDGTGRNQGQYQLSGSFSYHHRDIAQALTYDPTSGVTTYKPMNVSGAYNAHVEFSTDRNIGEKRYWTWHVNPGVDFTSSKDHALLQGQTESHVNTVNTLTLNSGANIRYNRKTLNVRAVGYINWRYSSYASVLGASNPSNPDLSVLDFQYGLEATYTTLALCGTKLGGLTLAADATMFSRRGYGADGLSHNDFVVNASLSQSFMKGKLILRLQAFDIFHQLSPTDYFINAQGRTVTYYRSLPHYVLLHTVYHWNKNPKKK